MQSSLSERIDSLRSEHSAGCMSGETKKKRAAALKSTAAMLVEKHGETNKQFDEGLRA